MHFYVSLFGNSQTVEARGCDAVVGFSSEAPQGLILGSLEAWEAVTHVAPATPQNYFCWHPRAEATFEPHGKNPKNVLAICWISGGPFEAPGAPENGAPVYTPTPF